MSSGARRSASGNRARRPDPVRTEPRPPLLPRPHLIVLAGLPGVGKSELARALAQRLGALWLRVDTIEASLLKAGIPRSFETGLAAYLAARDLAEEHLRLRGDVVIDAVNGVEPARQMWRELARSVPAKLQVVEVRCGDREEHRRRVESRAGPTPPLPAPTWEEVLNREHPRRGRYPAAPVQRRPHPEVDRPPGRHAASATAGAEDLASRRVAGGLETPSGEPADHPGTIFHAGSNQRNFA